jgi:hypothetical protein
MSDNDEDDAGYFYAPEATPMKLAPLSSDLVIRGGGGRDLIIFHADGTVTGAVEDASEAAAVFVRELQRLIADTRAAHDAELTEKAVTDLVADLKATPIVTLAGKGGAYEFIERRLNANNGRNTP